MEYKQAGVYAKSGMPHLSSHKPVPAVFDKKMVKVLRKQGKIMVVPSSQKTYRHLVVFSGGIDSTTVAYMLKDSAKETILFHLNQGWKKHEEAAQYIAKQLGMDMVTLDIRNIVHALKTPGQGHVPGYRQISYLIALSLADKYKASYVYTGEIDAPFRSQKFDSDPEKKAWLKYMNNPGFTGADGSLRNRNLLAQWYGQSAYNDPEKVYFIDPLNGMSKAGMLKLAKSLGVPFDKTVSCRNPLLDTLPEGLNHCGVCNCCISRRAGFKLAKLDDPSKYLKRSKIPREFLTGD
jgi:7-cyano-7-deazaguanine synthase